jgi:hypothetical protein
MTATCRRRKPAPERVEQTAHDLLTLLGGPDNIAEISYCYTKLRLTLLNRAAADDTGLLAHPAVLGLIEASPIAYRPTPTTTPTSRNAGWATSRSATSPTTPIHPSTSPPTTSRTCSPRSPRPALALFLRWLIEKLPR